MQEKTHDALKAEMEAFWRGLFAPDPGLINFRAPNWVTLGFFAAMLCVSRIEKRESYLGFLTQDIVVALGSGAVAVCFSRIIRFYGRRIAAFQPRSALEAKRANEQIKSVSTLFNALAGGGAIASTIKQLGEASPDYGFIVLTLGLGVWIHTGARNLLGLLKDENPEQFPHGGSHAQHRMVAEPALVPDEARRDS